MNDDSENGTCIGGRCRNVRRGTTEDDLKNMLDLVRSLKSMVSETVYANVFVKKASCRTILRLHADAHSLEMLLETAFDDLEINMTSLPEYTRHSPKVGPLTAPKD